MGRARFRRRVTQPKAPVTSGCTAKESQMEQGELFKYSPNKSPRKRKKEPQEYKLISLRECPTPEQMQLCDTPERAAEYWRQHVASHERFNPDCECFVILILNTRRRVRGHQLLTIGTMDTILVHPREVFRVAVLAGAAALIAMHNHPSGEPTPSEADIKVTRELIKAGQLLKIELCDHVIIGANRHCSLRELGYFYT